MDEHSPIELDPTGDQPQHELDDVARGLATGTLSRRGALKVGVAGAVGAAAVALGLAKPAPARKRAGACKHCGGETSCNTSMCGSPRGGETDCVCVKSVNGKQCCVGRNCEAKRCNRNSQCKNDEICSKEFKTFCFCKSSHADDKRNRKGVCLKRCADIH